MVGIANAETATADVLLRKLRRSKGFVCINMAISFSMIFLGSVLAYRLLSNNRLASLNLREGPADDSVSVRRTGSPTYGSVVRLTSVRNFVQNFRLFVIYDKISFTT